MGSRRYHPPIADRARSVRRGLGRLGAVGLLAVPLACDAVEDQTIPTAAETLVPLLTVTTVGVAPTTVTTTTVAAGTATTAASTTTVAAPTTTLGIQPVGDWDGARFDFGRIVAVGETGDGRYRTIELDRYSYRDPVRGALDAAGFDREPIAAWWREPPWENNNPTTRTFVLAPNVELLALAEGGRAAACTDPPPATPPPPAWEGVDPSFLATPAAREGVAIITYGAGGPITRIRFSSGC